MRLRILAAAPHDPSTGGKAAKDEKEEAKCREDKPIHGGGGLDVLTKFTGPKPDGKSEGDVHDIAEPPSE